MDNYWRGFEDALEMCLVEIRQGEGEEKIKKLLGLLKERKYDAIEKLLNVLSADSP